MHRSLYRLTGALALLIAAALAVSGCAATGSTSSAPKGSYAKPRTHKVKVRKAPRTERPQTLTGSGTENLGSIKVAVPSTLKWSCPSCGQDNYMIDNSFNDANEIDVNGLDQTSGQTYLDPGTYTDVQVETEGQSWTIRITPGNSTQQ